MYLINKYCVLRRKASGYTVTDKITNIVIECATLERAGIYFRNLTTEGLRKDSNELKTRVDYAKKHFGLLDRATNIVNQN